LNANYREFFSFQEFRRPFLFYFDAHLFSFPSPALTLIAKNAILSLIKKLLPPFICLIEKFDFDLDDIPLLQFNFYLAIPIFKENYKLNLTFP
jgi:hypothetical protein